MNRDPETLEDALDIISDLRDEILELRGEVSGLQSDHSAAESERNLAQGELDELQGEPGLQSAAEALIAEVRRPVGRINDMILPDTPAARRALLALHDAAGLAT